MPIYEYECQKCGRIETRQQKISDAPLKRCVDCAGELKKIISLTQQPIVKGYNDKNSYGLKGNKDKKDKKNV